MLLKSLMLWQSVSQTFALTEKRGKDPWLELEKECQMDVFHSFSQEIHSYIHPWHDFEKSHPAAMNTVGENVLQTRSMAF